MIEPHYPLTLYDGKRILRMTSAQREGAIEIVPRTLDDYLKESEAAGETAVLELQAVFEQAYRIALQVAELREKHGLTQAQLAERSGLSQEQISRLERGSVSPTSLTLAKVAVALGVELQLVEPVQG